MNNILTAQLSYNQAIIVKDIAQNQIKSLIAVSANNELLTSLPVGQKRDVISQLLRDFSRLIDFPNHLFNIHGHSQAMFRHELFTVTYGGQDARDVYNIDNYPADDIKALWRKIIASQEFKPLQLN